jgi:glycosyltransferase involved in cell wall biosynthesis
LTIKPAVSLLYVATVSSTLRAFLIPYAEYFRALGWRVDAASREATSDGLIQAAFDRVHDLPLSRSVVNVQRIVRSVWTISKLLDHDYDIVHVHTPIASFLTRLVTRLSPTSARPSVAYTAHGFHFQRQGSAPANLLYRTAERLAGPWADRLVVINDEDEQAARTYRIVSADRLVRMRGIGVDTRWFAPIAAAGGETPARDSANEDAPYFVCVAELSRRKRTADVVEALARLRNEHVSLVFVGDGPERGRLEELVDARGLRGRVRFTGNVDDVRPVVAHAAALVLASDREGLARSIMEALALEVPVIASTARGNQELLADGCGLMFRIGDVERLAAHMTWVLTHPAEAAIMGRRGRRRMTAIYDLPHLLQIHHEMYLQMLAGRMPDPGRLSGSPGPVVRQ